MKKIFTLLFCVAAMAFAAQADDNLLDQCINYLVNNGSTQTTIKLSELDANHDGVINISDVTFLINKKLNEGQVNNAPAVEQNDANVIIDNLLNDNDGTVTINDATEAINKELKKKK